VLADGQEFMHHLWAGDGRVYAWTRAGAVRSFGPPDIWAPPAGYVPPRYDALVATVDDGLGYRRFSMETARDTAFVARDFPAGTELMIADYAARPPVAVAQVSPGSSHYPAPTVLLSVQTGETLLEFVPESGFYGTTLAHDAQWIIGNVEHSPDGHRIEASELWVASRTGRWVASLRGATDGTEATSPRHGDWLAFNDLAGTVHIGRLRVRP
jgi:hypothetical protein